MKTKFLLIAAIIFLFGFKVQAQGVISPEDFVSSKLKYALKRIGTSVDNMMASTAEFTKDTSDETYFIYIYRRDTAVNIGFKKEEIDAATHVYIYLPRSYHGTVDLLLADLHFRQTDKSTAPGSFEYENVHENIFWQQDAENGMMVLIATKKD